MSIDIDTSQQMILIDQGEDGQPSEPTENTWSPWYTVLIINAICGVACLELAWYRTRRYRKPIPELEEKMPAFRRNDAKNWKKWKLYPGAALWMIPRILFAVVVGLILLVILQLFLIGEKPNYPMNACKRVPLRFVYKIGTYLFMLITNFCLVTWSHVDPSEVNYY